MLSKKYCGKTQELFTFFVIPGLTRNPESLNWISLPIGRQAQIMKVIAKNELHE